MSVNIRIATPDDAAACLSIYAPIVEHTPISFELIPPTAAEMAARIQKSLDHSLWLVAELDGQIRGYAYASQFRTRPAYDWTAETTIYIHELCRGQGLGRRLYTVLLGGLRLLGFRSAMAGATVPNDGSAKLHESVGFVHTGTVRDAGFKLGRWHDTAFWQVHFGPGSAPHRPPCPRAAASLTGNAEWEQLLARAAESPSY